MFRNKRPRSASAPKRWRLALEEASDEDLEAGVEAAASDEAAAPEQDACSAALDEVACNAEDDEDEDDEPGVDLLPELARWCRRSCREGGAVAECLAPVLRDVGTSHPRRILLALGATEHGRGFLLSCAEQYGAALRAAQGGERQERARLLAALASVKEALDDLPGAVQLLRQAVLLLDGASGGAAEEPTDDVAACAAAPPVASPCQLLHDCGVLPQTLLLPSHAAAAAAAANGARPGRLPPRRPNAALRGCVLSELVRLRRQQHATRVAAWWRRREWRAHVGSRAPRPAPPAPGHGAAGRGALRFAALGGAADRGAPRRSAYVSSRVRLPERSGRVASSLRPTQARPRAVAAARRDAARAARGRRPEHRGLPAAVRCAARLAPRSAPRPPPPPAPPALTSPLSSHSVQVCRAARAVRDRASRHRWARGGVDARPTARQRVERAVRPVRGHRPVRLPGLSQGAGRAYAPQSAARAARKPAAASAACHSLLASRRACAFKRQERAHRRQGRRRRGAAPARRRLPGVGGA